MKTKTAFIPALALVLLLTGCKPTYHTLGQAETANASAPPALQAQASAISEAAPQPEQPSASPQEAVSSEDAQSLALSHAGVEREQAVFTKVEQERDDGRQIYEVEFSVAGDGRYEYEIDAGTGEILKAGWEAGQSASSGQKVTADEAKALALAKAPGATLSDIREFKEDWDHGRAEYEGEIFYDGVTYEFEIDGSTGAFLSWEMEGAGMLDKAR